MMARRIVHMAVFAGLAVAAVLTAGRIVNPEPTAVFLGCAVLAVFVSLPGVISRRLVPVSLLLLPAGAYVLARAVIPLPPDVEGWGAQWAFYRQALSFGFDAYLHDVFPLTLGGVAGLELVVVLWTYLVLGAAGIVGLGLGRPVLGTGILLGLTGAAFTVDSVAADPRAVAVLFFLALLVILTSGRGAGRDEKHAASGRLVAGGLALGATGLVVAFALLSQVPGLAPAGWQDWREWQPFSEARGGSLVFNWKQNYPELLDPQNDFAVMRVTSPEPSYWRANTLEYFTGDAWLSQTDFAHRLGSERGRREIPAPSPAPPGETVTQRFDLESVYTSYLFTGGVPLAVDLGIPGAVWATEGGPVRADKSLGPPLSYQVDSVVPDVASEDLVGKGRSYEGVPGLGQYLQLPFPTREEADALLDSGRTEREILASSMPRGEGFVGIYGLNESIVGDASDPYEIALRIERALRRSYDYSLAPPASERPSPYAAFLLGTGVGYCQHFAGSMALLLRMNGIPSRVAVGFGRGTEIDENVYEVRTRNAHAWVEVLFPGIGWLPFEPTPSNGLPAGAASSTSPGFSDPYADQEAFPSAEEEEESAAADRLPEEGIGPPLADPEVSGGGSSAVRDAAGPVGMAAATVAALLFVWPLGRIGLRELWAVWGDPAERVRRSLALLRRELREWGMDVPESLTLDEVAALLRVRVGMDTAAAVERGQAVLFGGRRASSRDAKRVNVLRRQLRRRLRRQLGWGAALRAWYGVGGRTTSTAAGWTARRMGTRGA